MSGLTSDRINSMLLEIRLERERVERWLRLFELFEQMLMEYRTQAAKMEATP